MKTPCEHCPYRNDVKPYLTPERGEELAILALNQYNSFYCHKTTEDYEDDRVCTNKSKLCAGFLTLMGNECGEKHLPEGFKPSYEIVYCDTWEMTETYNEENEENEENE